MSFSLEETGHMHSSFLNHFWGELYKQATVVECTENDAAEEVFSVHLLHWF